MKRVKRNDRGSSLIIALAFLLLFSLWLSATLTSTQGGLRLQQATKVQPKRLYSADGAIEQAIQGVRYDETGGRWDDPDCSFPSANSTFTVQDPPQTVHVRCEPDGSSGLGEAGESSPPIGIIALSNGAAGEYAYQQYGNSIVRIDGGVFSNTPVLFQNGQDCGATSPECQQLNLCPRNDKIITDGVLVRNSTTVTSLSARFVEADVGAPIAGNGIPTGTRIASRVNLTTITMTNQALSTGVNRVIRYHEDYPRLQQHCKPRELSPGVPDVEEMKKGRLTAVPRSGYPEPFPESCNQARIVALQFNCDNTYVADPDGVDKNYPPDKVSGFALRGVPACPVGARVVELLPGRYNDAAALTALTTTCDAIIWFTPGTYYFDFNDPTPVWTIGSSNRPNLQVIGGVKTWDREPFTASVSYNQGTKRSTVTASSAVFKLSDANAAYINAAYNLPYKTLIRSVSVDRKSATFDGQPLTQNFNGLFTVSPIVGTKNPLGSMCDPATNVDHAGVEFIFGRDSRMVLTDGKTEICSPVSVSSNPPRQQIAIYGAKTDNAQLRAQSGCILAQPYTPSGGSGCPMILAPQGSKPAFIVHGTIYAPHAAIDLSLQGVGYQVVSRGVIARVVAFAISPSSLFSDALIFSPNFDSVPGAPRKMTMTACIGGVCPPDGSGVPRIRALVRIKDTDEHENPGLPGYKVWIDSWSVL